MSDATLRLLITVSLLALFFGLEVAAPARAPKMSMQRVANQAGMALLSSILAKLALGGGLAGIALFAQSHSLGLLHVVIMPDWLAIGFCFLVLDLAIWAQHLVLHRVPWLWRLHRVHHGDTTMDVTTSLRFHPFEILVSLAFKAALVIALGAPAAAVLAFEIMLGAGALFTHANVALPSWLERPLRLVVVTPALHLIHHSPNPIETNSNFGFSFSFWDRIFGTYRGARLEADGPIGLEDWRGDQHQKLFAMLANPFK